MKNLLPVILFAMAACNQPKIAIVTTTANEPWVISYIANEVSSTDNSDLVLQNSDTMQTIEGFGTCFNELGWTSLQRLSEEDRENIMRELFAPEVGANFVICRMPVAANDFARKWYCYNETEGDFDMTSFSISTDMETLVPFIKNAKKYNPNLKVWASPWSPPQWMKYNKHYAARSTWIDPSLKKGKDHNAIDNGLPKEKEGKEGTDMFIQEPSYYEAYALYFKKFIEAYRNEGINIFMVMPQNEFNSAQIFPSCTWTSKGLTEFVGKYLGPTMKKLEVEIMFGTMERGNEALVDTILTDPEAKQYVSGVGFQWAGKKSIAGIYKRYPNLKLYQTEQECGDGNNDWKSCIYSWSLMKHYLTNGANAYMYWNTSLDKGGISTWGWRQNSLVSVDTTNNSYSYNPEYYLLKHVSHFVRPGAKRLNSTGAFKNLLAFKNPDGSTVLVLRNELQTDKQIIVKLNDKNISIPLKADSFTTVKIQ